ncbi:serine protease [Solirhodobacter olei]|uniref:serine protease n=1 Tax=Solirhodobacter olei TaxID=2493082 RepID=UPI000FDC96AC|nr:serine protease [Solirhodobacter olei]
MKRIFLTVFALAFAGIASAAAAQSADQTGARTGAWVQIEARPDLPTAEANARAFAARLPDVVGYRLPSGWFAIALGPYSRDQAYADLAQLRGTGAIPSDSYVVDGSDYGQKFWPPGSGDGSANGATAGAQVDVSPLAPAPGTAQTGDQAGTQTPAQTADQTGTQTAAQTGTQDAAQIAGLPQQTPAEARQAEALLSRDDRMEIQNALVWYGDYGGPIDGDFGPGTRTAMAAWQREHAFDDTGILTARQRKALLDGYHSEQAALGLKAVSDSNAGIDIDLPLALVHFAGYQPPFAHYTAEGDSGVQISLISAPGDRATLSGLYDLLQSLAIMPRNGQRDLNGRSFDISGQSDSLHAFAHAELVDGAVKGYLVSWKPAGDARMAHALAEMKASFRSTGPQSLDGSMVPLTAGQKSGMVAGLARRKPVVARSGFFVDAGGDVLTTTDVLKNCGALSFGDGHKASLAFRDDSLGIALLKPAEPLAPQAFAQFSQAAPGPAARIAAAGYSYGGQLIAAAMTFGSFEAGTGLNGEADLRRLSLSALPGDAGGPVLDPSGALVGMLLPPPSDATKVLPKSVALAVGAGPIAKALQAQGITPAEAQPGQAMDPEDLAALGRKMTVLVSCWK